jgi:large subunit ribosomal protein L33
MASKVRIKIKLQSTQSPYYYTTTRKKVVNSPKLELSKWDKVLRKHVSFKEEKI